LGWVVLGCVGSRRVGLVRVRLVGVGSGRFVSETSRILSGSVSGSRSGLCWVGFDWAKLNLAGLSRDVLGWAGLCFTGLGWARSGWVGFVLAGLCWPVLVGLGFVLGCGFCLRFVLCWFGFWFGLCLDLGWVELG
jgi:hypothetical protein